MTDTQTVNVKLRLRSRQTDYLEYLSDRDDVSLTGAFLTLLENSIDKLPASEDTVRLPKKKRVHFLLPVRYVTYIDKMAVRMGIARGEVARRLIDQAISKDPTI